MSTHNVIHVQPNAEGKLIVKMFGTEFEMIVDAPEVAVEATEVTDTPTPKKSKK